MVRESPALAVWFTTSRPPIGGELAGRSELITALAVSHAIQSRTGLSIAHVVKQLRPLRSTTITINGTTQTFPPGIPADQRHILDSLGIKTGY